MNTDTDEIMYMKPRAIGKAELATRLGYNSAGYFFKLVQSKHSVMNKLAETGYQRNQKMLTAKQMIIICEVFGYPVINH